MTNQREDLRDQLLEIERRQERTRELIQKLEHRKSQLQDEIGSNVPLVREVQEQRKEILGAIAVGDLTEKEFNSKSQSLDDTIAAHQRNVDMLDAIKDRMLRENQGQSQLMQDHSRIRKLYYEALCNEVIAEVSADKKVRAALQKLWTVAQLCSFDEASIVKEAIGLDDNDNVPDPDRARIAAALDRDGIIFHSAPRKARAA